MSFHFGWRTEHDVVKGDKLTDGSRVKSVHAYIVDGKGQEEKAGGGGDCHSQVNAHWIVDSPIANPMSLYAEHKTNRKNWGIDVLGTVICIVELENGIQGVGVSVGGPPACYIIEEHLSRFVEGQDPRNVELIWDQMWRSTVNYGRKGLPLQAISAVDLAIWDCLGKVRKEPVYNLLGGKTKQRLPVYGTTQRPELAKKLGLCGAKIPLPYGPIDGDAGMRANIERIKACREAVGPDFPLMIDCYMSLTVPYTIELARRIDREVPGGVKWIEEHLPPDDYDGYAEVKKRVDTNLWTCGEHEYTRYGFKMLLERKCCDLLQPDMCWVGGLTEARRIVALAAAYDIPVIPHGSSVFSYHMQIAFPNCPIAESIILSPDAASIQPIFGKLFLDEPLPVDGFVTLDPSKHGFGITLNPDIKLVRPYEHTFRSAAQSAPDFVDQKEWLAKASKINTDPNDTRLWKS